MRLGDHFVEAPQHVGGKTERVKVAKNLRAFEQANDHAFSVKRGDRRDAEIDILTCDPGLDPTVLRQPPLGDVELSEDLYAGNNRGFELARRRIDLM